MKSKVNDEQLSPIAAEMQDLCAELKTARRQGKTKVEIEDLKERARDLMGELETDYGVPAFKKEVPTETVKTFFALRKLVCGV